MTQTISATQARRDLFSLIRKASKGSTVRITLNGELPVIMMSEEEFEGWMETMDIMSDPQLMKEIKEAEAERGAVDWDDLKKELKL